MRATGCGRAARPDPRGRRPDGRATRPRSKNDQVLPTIFSTCARERRSWRAMAAAGLEGRSDELLLARCHRHRTRLRPSRIRCWPLRFHRARSRRRGLGLCFRVATPPGFLRDRLDQPAELIVIESAQRAGEIRRQGKAGRHGITRRARPLPVAPLRHPALPGNIRPLAPGAGQPFPLPRGSSRAPEVSTARNPPGTAAQGVDLPVGSGAATSTRNA